MIVTRCCIGLINQPSARVAHSWAFCTPVKSRSDRGKGSNPAAVSFFFPWNMLSFIVSLPFLRKQTPNQHSNGTLEEKIQRFSAGCLRCVFSLSHFRPRGGTLENCFFQIQICLRENEWLISRYIKNKFPRGHDMTWNRQFTYAAKVMIHSQANLCLRDGY